MSPERRPISPADLDDIVEAIDSLNHRLRIFESMFPHGALATAGDGHVHQESMEVLDDGVSQGKGFQIDVTGITGPTRSGRRFTLALGALSDAVLALDVKKDGVLVGSVPAALTELEVKKDGVVVGSAVGTGTAAIDAWPVGSVFISVVSTNPNTLLGGGTWSAIATGRMLVGIDAADVDFDTVEETGGAKTHTHGNHVVTQPASHGSQQVSTAGTGNAADDTAHTGTAVDAHNTPASVPPFYVVYIWKRTA